MTTLTQTVYPSCSLPPMCTTCHTKLIPHGGEENYLFCDEPACPKFYFSVTRLGELQEVEAMAIEMPPMPCASYFGGRE